MKSVPCARALLLSAAVAIVTCNVADGGEAQADGDRNNPQAHATAHESSFSTLDALAKSQPEVISMIQSNDIAGLRKVHEGAFARIAEIREHMDKAILLGRWRTPAARIEALELLSRLEGIRILNRMNLAFLNGYPQPTTKVSASVADATQKMFSQIVILRDATRQLNALGAAAAQSN